MGRSSTTFKPGHPGGPGRPKGKTFRDALKAELAKPDPDTPTETRYQAWARKVVMEADVSGNAAKLEVIKFLEGASPPDKGRDDEEPGDAEAHDDNGNPIEP